MWTVSEFLRVVGLLSVVLTALVDSQGAGLHFTIGTRELRDGDSVNISDIGSQPGIRSDPGNTIICNTTYVNMQCCRSSDSGIGAIGNWYTPTGSAVVPLSNFKSLVDTLYRVVYAQQIRLGSLGSPTGPLGVYTCSVPDGNGGAVNASITLINILSVSSVYIHPANLKVVAGESLTLTCIAIVTGRGTPSFTWTGQASRGPQIGQLISEITNMFADTLAVDRVSPINSTVECVASIINSTISASVTLSITVPQTSVSISESNTPIVGQNYILTCNVNATVISMTVLYSWMEDNNLLAGETTNQLDLSPLELFHNQTHYTCLYMASLSYINSIIRVNATHEVVILVTVSSVTITPTNSSGVASQSVIIFTCTGTLSGPALPKIMWTGPVTRTPTQPAVPVSSFSDSLVLTRVRQSYAGMYTCTVSVGASSMSSVSVKLTVFAPPIPISVIENQSPVGLRDYILICEVLPPSSLAIFSPSYQWSRNGQVLLNQTKMTLDLSPLQPTENDVQYTCEYRASSIFIANVNASITHTIGLTLAPLTNPSNIQGILQPTSVRLMWTQSELDVVENYTVSYTRTAGCFEAPSGHRTIEGSLRSFTLSGLEENITYDVAIMAMNTMNTSSATESFSTLSAFPSGKVQNLTSGQEVNYTSITLSWQSVNCLQQNSPITSYTILYRESTFVTGPLSTVNTSFIASSLFPGTSYTFEVAAVNSYGIGPQRTYTVSTRQPINVLFLNGQSFFNNSIVSISDIGEDMEALFCFTDEIRCCRSQDNLLVGTQDWYFPDGSVIGSQTSNNVSRSRGPRSVILQRDSALIPNGIYRCRIYDVNIYVGLYGVNTGVLILQSISYNTTTGIVTCVSTGGPVTNLTWNRNGESYQWSKLIVDTIKATYHSLLYISSNTLSDYTGMFSCRVSNSRGSVASQTGKFKAIGLKGNKTVYEVGSAASVICFSNFTVISIRWLIESSKVSFSINQTKHNEVNLSVNDGITEEAHGTKFTCEVINQLPTGTAVTSSVVFVIQTSEEDQMTTMKQPNSSDFNIVVVAVSVIVCVILPTVLIPSTLIIIYKIKTSRSNASISTNVPAEVAASEYEEIGGYRKSMALKSRDSSMNYEEINMKDSVYFKEINLSTKTLKDIEI